MENRRRPRRFREGMLLAVVPIGLFTAVRALPGRDRSEGRAERATTAQGEDPTDLAFTAEALRALRAAGLPEDDPCVVRAVEFLSRFGGPSGLAGKGSEARGLSGEAACLGVSGLLAAGVDGDDPRVRGAVAWLEGHYTLEANPGAEPPRRGLYRYYFELARAMTALKVDRIRDAEGAEHDWRAELSAFLAREQRPDGSWANPQETAEDSEGHVTVATSYAVLTLRLILDRDGTRPAGAR
jgi:hypothetical protein